MIRMICNSPRLRAALCRAAALTIVLAICLTASWPNPGTAAVASREYLIKAAFVYEVLKATQWPEPALSRIVLCVRGTDPFGSAWKSIQGLPLGSRTLQVRHQLANAAVSGCHALFLGISERQWWSENRIELATQPILTVSEMSGFAANGGMVAMMNVDNRLRFDVNLKAVHAAKLEVNTEALELANMIHAGAAHASQP